MFPRPRNIAVQLAEVLVALMEHKVIHNDLKPANILYDETHGTVGARSLCFPSPSLLALTLCVCVYACARVCVCAV